MKNHRPRRALRLPVFVCLLVLSLSIYAQAPKREFRGAWMQVVNGQYLGLTPAEQQERLLEQLDVLQRMGVNAVFFQVRPEADALYLSYYEPWSRWLTGEQGVAPDPFWDPLQFMIDACHARQMELHAWINPYRAKLKGMTTAQLNFKHPYKSAPDRFVEYDGMLIFDPALQLNRDYICQIATDIVKRYDVDGLHIDDYFYPYPAGGLEFDDAASFAADPRGFSDRDDWRRDNVNRLVWQLSKAVHDTKPWVKFGISPFGIYHNGTDDAIPGSDTRGLQNYDDLYADVLLWVREGWVDYTIPQLYWQIGHPTADYATLVTWWAENAAERPLFVGQDLERSLQYADPEDPTADQLARKFALQDAQPAIDGYCWWYADALRQHPVAAPSTLALVPRMEWLDKKAPGSPRKPALVCTDDGPVLFWTAPKYKDELQRPVRYVVYRFLKGEKTDLRRADRIAGMTSNTYFLLAPEDGDNRYTYVVTALDRLSNESKGCKIKIEL